MNLRGGEIEHGSQVSNVFFKVIFEKLLYRDRSYNIRKKGNKGEEKEQQFPRLNRKNSYC